jgi:hypothetical protein
MNAVSRPTRHVRDARLARIVAPPGLDPCRRGKRAASIARTFGIGLLALTTASLHSSAHDQPPILCFAIGPPALPIWTKSKDVSGTRDIAQSHITIASKFGKVASTSCCRAHCWQRTRVLDQD